MRLRQGDQKHLHQFRPHPSQSFSAVRGQAAQKGQEDLKILHGLRRQHHGGQGGGDQEEGEGDRYSGEGGGSSWGAGEEGGQGQGGPEDAAQDPDCGGAEGALRWPGLISTSISLSSLAIVSIYGLAAALCRGGSQTHLGNTLL